MNKKLINGIIYVVLVGLAVAFLYPLFCQDGSVKHCHIYRNLQ